MRKLILIDLKLLELKTINLKKQKTKQLNYEKK